jgi:predicted RNA-binding Zn-ribbon protein involved in translation (DUF1610 family)
MANDSGILPNGTRVRMKSGSQGWVEGQIVEYYDVISYPALHMATYGGGETPGYKVYVLEGKHKGETIRMPMNYVERVPGKSTSSPSISTGGWHVEGHKWVQDSAVHSAGHCSQCGGSLTKLPKDRGQTQNVYKCQSCGRVYWE